MRACGRDVDDARVTDEWCAMWMRGRLQTQGVTQHARMGHRHDMWRGLDECRRSPGHG